MEVLSKDVPDLLRLVVNKMEIIERHAYLQVCTLQGYLAHKKSPPRRTLR